MFGAFHGLGEETDLAPWSTTSINKMPGARCPRGGFQDQSFAFQD